MVDLCSGWKRQIELGWKMEVKIEIFFRRSADGIGSRKAGKGGGGWHHQQRQGLWTGWVERLLLAISYVICFDVVDTV